jgi:hypothetical protein
MLLSGRPPGRQHPGSQAGQGVRVRRSAEGFVTTHVGSLPYPESGLPSDPGGLAGAVAEVVARQRATGLDVVNEGERFAARVGRENVIAGADCGFGGRSHPQIAWAKLRALVDGARLASAGPAGT